LALLLDGSDRDANDVEARVRTLLAPLPAAASQTGQFSAEELGLSVDDVLQRTRRRNRKAK